MASIELTCSVAPIRFLVSDVDGTLVDHDKRVTPAASEAVDALREAGVGFAFISSRPPMGLESIARALGSTPSTKGVPAAGAFNGGALLDASLVAMSFRPLDEPDARTALDVIASLKIGAWVFTLDEWLVLDADGDYVGHETMTIGHAPRVVERFDDVSGIGKIVAASGDAELLARAEREMHRRLSTQAAALRSQSYYLDVTHVDANKGAGLRAIAKAAGLALDEVAAIGDMDNDLAMLGIAGLSIAMGNAPDEVKAKVDAVTATNREDGFAKAVREVVLKRI